MEKKTLKQRIKENPGLKQAVHRFIMHPVKTRPNWWIRLFDFIYLKRGKGSVIYRSVRKDLPPFNRFFLGKYSVVEDFSCLNNAVGDLTIGDYTRIGLRNTIIGPVHIGNHVNLAQNVTVTGLNHNYLDAAKGTIAAANAADYVIGIPSLILMFAAPAIYKNSKLLRKLWPYEMTEAELQGDGDHEELMASKEWSIQEIAWLLAIGFGTVWAATTIAGMVFGPGFRSAGRIILITTFSIIIAQIPAVRKLRGNFDLGLFVALLFLTTIGFAVDLKQFFGSTFYITLFCFCVIVSCIVLHLLVTRLLKVKFEYVLLSAVACISDGPTAALIASSAQWKTMITTGLLMGVLAGAMGNYLGIAVAYAIRGIIGV